MKPISSKSAMAINHWHISEVSSSDKDALATELDETFASNAATFTTPTPDEDPLATELDDILASHANSTDLTSESFDHSEERPSYLGLMQINGK
jgi:hypothetical protein